MATTGKMNATLLAIYVGGTKITHATEGSISMSMETRDVTTKDSNGYRELLEATRSYSGSFSAIYADDATYGVNALQAAWAGRTALTIRFSTEVSGDDYFEGSAYLTSLEVSGGVEDNVSVSGSFEFTGTQTFTTVA